MPGAFELDPFRISFGVLGNAERRNIGQGLAGLSAEPKEMIKPQIGRDDDPYHASALLFTELKTHLYAGRLSSNDRGLELNVPDDAARCEDQIVAPGVELRPEHLDAGNSLPPETAEQIADENMLDYPLP